MLCRVADSLFWMSRYIERAENTAQVVDVNLQGLLEEESKEGKGGHGMWGGVLRSFGDDVLYEKLYGELDGYRVTEFLAFSQDNPSSVYSCVLAARENARMIRDQISSEMWEVVNRMYLFMRGQNADRVMAQGTYDFFRRIKEYSHLFSGVTDATFPRKVGYEFLRAGCYLERADKTGRILNSKNYIQSDVGDAASPVREISQWIAVLKSCGGLEAYGRIHVGEIVPERAIEFLVKSREFPRSVLFCLKQLQSALHGISGCPVSHYSNEAERICGRLISTVVYSGREEIIQEGIHSFLIALGEQIERVAVELGNSYMYFPIVDPTEGGSRQSQRQN